MIKKYVQRFKKNHFLFEELVQRDFKQKYKRTALGMAWSVLSPLLTLLIMKIVFTQFFGKSTPHYTIYLFSGNLVMAYFKESTRGGMNSLMANSKIFTKINVPKYMFLLSKNVSALINFGLTLCVYFLFCAFDRITFHIRMVMLVYPVLCMLLMNIGIGMILSAMFVFFRDTEYLYDVFLTLLTYLSAIFYRVDNFSVLMQNLFYLNPVYCNIKYFRTIVIDGVVPPLFLHVLCLGYAIICLLAGFYIYKRYNHEFLYYV